IASYGSVLLDIEQLPKLRAGKYPLHKYQQIVIYSAPRTGSSLLYNVLRFLFEEDQFLNSPHNYFDAQKVVLKTHKNTDLSTLSKERILYIVPIRNPMNACISNHRIRTAPILS